MRVKDVMTRGVASCNPGTDAAVAAEIMWNADIGFLPVVEDGGRTVGVVTDRDLFIALATRNRRASDLPIGEIMQEDLSFCTPDDDVHTALQTMARRQVHRLPVVDKTGALEGVLSMNDIVLRAGVADLQDKEVVQTMHAICEHPLLQRAAQVT